MVPAAQEQNWINYGIVKAIIAVGFIINIITCLVLWFYAKPSAHQVALHYNVVVGFNELGSGYRLYQLPLLGFIVTSINVLLVRTFKERQVYLSAAASTVALLTALVLLFAALLLRLEVAR